MFLAITLAVSIVLSMIAAVVVDTLYHAIAERRWEAVWPLIASVAVAVGALYAPLVG